MRREPTQKNTILKVSEHLHPPTLCFAPQESYTGATMRNAFAYFPRQESRAPRRGAAESIATPDTSEAIPELNSPQTK